MGVFRKLAKAGVASVTSYIEFNGLKAKHMLPTQSNAKYIELKAEDMESVSETHVVLPEFKMVGHGREPMGFTIAVQFNPKLLPGMILLEAKAGDILEIPSSLTKFKVERLDGLSYIVRLYLLEV